MSSRSSVLSDSVGCRGCTAADERPPLGRHSPTAIADRSTTRSASTDAVAKSARHASCPQTYDGSNSCKHSQHLAAAVHAEVEQMLDAHWLCSHCPEQVSVESSRCSHGRWQRKHTSSAPAPQTACSRASIGICLDGGGRPGGAGLLPTKYRFSIWVPIASRTGHA